MLSKLSVVQLGGISIVGGIVAVFCAKAETKIKSNQWEQQPYCQESLKLLKNHEGANYILGQEFAVKVYLLVSFRCISMSFEYTKLLRYLR